MPPNLRVDSGRRRAGQVVRRPPLDSTSHTAAGTNESRPMDIFVGNFPFQTTEEELTALFEEHGQVDRVHLVNDRETGRPRGFGFVTMKNDAEANAAIKALENSDLGGRPLRVNEARPREDRR
ncbi:MAG: RNA-binding protein [Verrucomicrobiota bacterium]